jgi:hypothetical protein
VWPSSLEIAAIPGDTDRRIAGMDPVLDFMAKTASWVDLNNGASANLQQSAP